VAVLSAKPIRLGCGVWWWCCLAVAIWVSLRLGLLCRCSARCSAGPRPASAISVVCSRSLLLLIPRASIRWIWPISPPWEGWPRACPNPPTCFDLPPRHPPAGSQALLVYLDGIHQVERDIHRGCAPGLERSSGSIRARSVKGMESYTVPAGESWQTMRGSALACGAGCLPCRREHPHGLDPFLAAFPGARPTT